MLGSVYIFSPENRESVHLDEKYFFHPNIYGYRDNFFQYCYLSVFALKGSFLVRIQDMM